MKKKPVCPKCLSYDDIVIDVGELHYFCENCEDDGETHQLFTRYEPDDSEKTELIGFTLYRISNPFKDKL